uniref:Uncharacterized protein n=1 Tax=Oryza glumipatula TaxID=40148 RepID=A0A0D9Y365_9ORYZ
MAYHGHIYRLTWALKLLQKRCTYYRLALVGSFLAGVAQVAAAVWVVDDPRSRRAVAKKIIYASIAPLVVAVGLTGAVLLLW